MAFLQISMFCAATQSSRSTRSSRVRFSHLCDLGTLCLQSFHRTRATTATVLARLLKVAQMLTAGSPGSCGAACAERKAKPRGSLQPRDIARHRVALALRQRLHHLRHVLVVGALVVGEAAHGGDEVLVAQPGEPRAGRTALEILLMAGLALRDPLR